MAKPASNTKQLLKDHLASLQARKSARLAVTAPIQAELDALNAQIETLRAQAKALARSVKSDGGSDGDDVASIDQEIAQVALALGAAKMSDGVVAE